MASSPQPSPPTKLVLRKEEREKTTSLFVNPLIQWQRPYPTGSYPDGGLPGRGSTRTGVLPGRGYRSRL
jgi:hypothetical protein